MAILFEETFTDQNFDKFDQVFQNPPTATIGLTTEPPAYNGDTFLHIQSTGGECFVRKDISSFNLQKAYVRTLLYIFPTFNKGCSILGIGDWGACTLILTSDKKLKVWNRNGGVGSWTGPETDTPLADSRNHNIEVSYQLSSSPGVADGEITVKVGTIEVLRVSNIDTAPYSNNNVRWGTYNIAASPGAGSVDLAMSALAVGDAPIGPYQSVSYSLEIKNQPADQSMGSTVPSPGIYPVNMGMTVDITAYSAVGHKFDDWELNGMVYPATTNPISIEVYADSLITAYFSEIQAPPPPPPSPLSKLHVQESKIINEKTQETRLVGFNVHPIHPTDPPMTMTESALAWMASKGFNCVRAVIYQEDFHLGEGIFDESYFVKLDPDSPSIDRFIALCEKYNLYVILDMHQWGVGSQWGGRGFPTWLTSYAADKETFVMDFFTGTGNGDYTLQQFIEAWKYLLSRYGNLAVIAGYNIINEPHNMASNWTQRAAELGPLIAHINDTVGYELQQLDPATILFYSPMIDYSSDGGADSNPKPLLTNVAWARNHYDYESAYQTQGRDAVYMAYVGRMKAIFDKLLREYGIPIIFTEMGTNINNNLIWCEDTFELVFQNIASPGEWGVTWWRYTTWEIWSPINPDGSDTPIVPLLQEQIWLSPPKLSIPSWLIAIPILGLILSSWKKK